MAAVVVIWPLIECPQSSQVWDWAVRGLPVANRKTVFWNVLEHSFVTHIRSWLSDSDTSFWLGNGGRKVVVWVYVFTCYMAVGHSEKESLGGQTRIWTLSEDQFWKASCCATQPGVLIPIGDRDNRWKPIHQPNGPANRKGFGGEWRVSWAKSTGLTVCTLIHIFDVKWAILWCPGERIVDCTAVVMYWGS